jgi:hypothetical protein
LYSHSPSVDFLSLKSRQGYSFDSECFDRFSFAVQTFCWFRLLQLHFLRALYSISLFLAHQILSLPRFFVTKSLFLSLCYRSCSPSHSLLGPRVCFVSSLSEVDRSFHSHSRRLKSVW